MPKQRLTAEERHDQLIRAAVTAFTTGGYAGTTTDQVARLAGVSQPYVIRLFGSKQALFLATVRYAADRVEERFHEAARTDPTIPGLGRAYEDLLSERDLITVLLHGFAAGGDPAIGPAVRTCYGGIYRTVQALTGASAGEIRGFLAQGMLLTVLGAMRVIGPDAVVQESWMTELLTYEQGPGSDVVP
ncbi:TetR/AcrR family transcriptional regulator [Actinoplanes sp. NPDC051494]|uniref:TetR/AcrR family transcriptional regulator n=1 Tax=Actinoplanes sp. NPDC051494 TaxID=3363907 RepID=UPI00378CC886